MPAEDASVVAASSPIVVDAATQKQDIARQLFSGNATSEGVIAQLASNPFFTAGFGLAGLGAAAAFARRGVRRSAELIRRRLLVDVEINNKDDSYPWFLYWMTMHQQQQLVKKGGDKAVKSSFVESIFQKLTPSMRQLSIETNKVTLPNGSLKTHFALVPGPGRHFMRYHNAFIMVNRQRQDNAINMQTGRPWETVTLTTLYSQRHVFESLFREAHEIAAKSHEGKTVIYNSWGADWQKFGNPRRKRPLESVILDAGVKERIVRDVQDFLSSSKWYHDAGIPYRRGYLLHGPPGTGKSSFIQALAGYLDYDIAILNLSERGLTDDRLSHLLTKIPPRTLVLLEDVDVAFGRRTQTAPDGYQGANVTFSGLLNALDGVASAEERIIFLTTNHVDRLDEALVRPGRVDMTVRLGEATRYQAEQLWGRFYGNLDADDTYKLLFCNRLTELGLLGSDKSQARTAMSTAALQGLFLYNKDDMLGAIKMAEQLLGRHQQGQDKSYAEVQAAGPSP